MWDLLKKSKEECVRFRDDLEVSAGSTNGEENVARLLAKLPEATRVHGLDCADCRTAAAQFLKVRALLTRMPTGQGKADNPWFAGRVMAAISRRETELRGPAGTWIALPKLASRFALAACAVLLVGSTWLYQRPRNSQRNQPTASAGPEYLFDAPAAPMTQDDVLVSLAENNQ